MPDNPPEDLSNILKRVVHRSEPTKARTRRELANDVTTREFLEAGLRLLTGQHGEVTDVDDGDARKRPFFDWLTVERVTGEVNRNGHVVSDNQHRYRWPSRDDYIEDLLAYSLWEGHWPATAPIPAEDRDNLLRGDFVEAIHQVAYQNITAVSESMAFRVGMIASAMAKDDPLILEASTKTYRVITDHWSRLYQSVFDSRGLTLRAGVTLSDFTVILTALSDGLSMRMVTDPGTEIIDHEKQRSLLGKAALAVAIAFLDPGDGMSVEDLVRLVEGKEADSKTAGTAD